MIRLYISLILLFPFLLNAQVVRQPLSVRYAGLGAYSKNFVDIFSGTNNQAALAQIKSGGFGIYGERRFMLEELNQFTAMVAMPTSSGTFALQVDYFGFSSFNENQIGLAYARSVAEKIDVGVKFNYHSVQAGSYGNASAINFEAGTIFHLTENLHTGLHVYNPLSSKLGKNTNEYLASIYKVGIGYDPSARVFISTEIVKQEDQSVSVNVGLQYNLHEKIFIRGGITTLTSNSYFGVGLNLGIIRLDVNTAYHPQLGFTPGVLVLFNFKKADKQ
ncbi:MAG TPA: hypothetical protein VF622_09905 [Segetibacter sp.]